MNQGSGITGRDAECSQAQLLAGPLLTPLAACHHADPANADPLENIHHVNEFLDGQIPIWPHNYGNLRISRFKSGELRLKSGLARDFSVKLQDIVAVDLNDLSFFRVDLCLCRCAAGNNKIDTVLHEGRCDHENDQEHETQIQQRSDVQLRERVEGIARAEAAHD
jgi:hypothetical protein